MRVDQGLKGETGLKQLLLALDNRLTAVENFAPAGVPDGYVLTSTGLLTPPEYRPAAAPGTPGTPGVPITRKIITELPLLGGSDLSSDVTLSADVYSKAQIDALLLLLGSGIPVLDEGGDVLTPATSLDFVGAGVSAADGGGGLATITIPGANSDYPAGLSAPAEVLLTADAGIGLSDGGAITTWGNQGTAGSAKDHANSGGTDRPIFRATDSEDGLPYVEFDGVDDFLECTGMTPYTGGELTGYLVARISDNAASDKLFGLGNTGSSDSTVTTGCCLIYLSQHQIAIMRNNAQVSPSNLAALGGRQLNTNYDWFIFAFRYKVLMGRAVLQVWLNNQKIGVDQGGASLVAFNFDNSILGAGYNVATGTKAARPRMDVRHWSYRLAANTSIQIRDDMRYLANKWKVPILD